MEISADESGSDSASAGVDSDVTGLHPHLDRVLLDAETIRKRVAEMGREITADYAGRELTILTILQGGAVFMADLIREIPLSLRLGSISVSSYHEDTKSSGRVTFHQDNLPEMAGRDVLIVDDILDSGRTLSAIRERLLKEEKPLSVKICVLLDKQVERACDVAADYAGFQIGDEFVVGYGLDYAGAYRNLPVIGVLKTEIVGAGAQAT